ncbi:protein YIPF6-like isoform X2 [Uranotaenia lowii]|uniref:protein YIPF6-like isoform X2 n=1 Tax=Uranotaenia lowii TaxID=190385 RepID=UPI0024793F82|nr:protein YIPF6-like isoform X2 [Uranotaenia lowii]
MSSTDAKLELYDDYASATESMEGQMAVPSAANRNTTDPGAPNFSTLDEPIKDTFLRDVKAVGVKFYHVMIPKEKNTLLRDWDLWGPLILCTFMGTIIQGSANDKGDGGPEFAQFFVIVWFGAMIVTLNSKLLGGNISFFQSVCVLGYCLTPCAVALMVCRIILVAEQTAFLFFLRLLVAATGFGWATYGSP